MIWGVPLEIRSHEHRVGAVPFLVEELVEKGHKVLVETTAGQKSHYPDDIYEKAGAVIVPSPEKLYGKAEIILKVKGIMPVEYDLIRPEHIIWGYFHFFRNLDMARALMSRGCTCLTYDMLLDEDGNKPMMQVEGQIIGQLAVQQGAYYLTQQGGRGLLLGTVPGVSPVQVVVLGASDAGISAAAYAANLGATVLLLDEDYQTLRNTKERLPSNVNMLIIHEQNLKKIFPNTDLLVCAFQKMTPPGTVLVSKELVKLLPKGAIIIDLDIDYGGTVETSTPTSYENPALLLDGVIHYCVPNLAGVVPGTASEALGSALLPHLKKIITTGFEEAIKTDKTIASSVAVYEGRITHPELAKALGVAHYQFDESGH